MVAKTEIGLLFLTI